MLTPFPYDNVQESTATTGTGTLTLGGATDGHQSFACVGNGNSCYYKLHEGAGGSQQWEVGVGVYSTSGPTLTRDARYGSDGNSTLITLGSLTKTVSLVAPSDFLASLPRTNLLPNGGFDLWQAGDTFTPAGDTVTRTADAWWVTRITNPDFTVTQETGVNGRFCIRVQRDDSTSDLGVIKLFTQLESKDCRWAKNRLPFTLSFNARKGSGYSAAGAMLHVYVYSGAGSDEENLYGTPFTAGVAWSSITIPLTTSMVRHSVPVLITFGTPKQLAIEFTLVPTGTASDDYFDLECVKLEQGETATPYEHRPIAETLAMCQRYYYKTFRLEDAPAQAGGTDYQSYCVATGTGAVTNVAPPTYFPPMRDRGNTVTLYNPVSSNAHLRNDGQSQDTSGETAVAEINFFQLTYTGSAGTVPGDIITYHFTVEDPIF